MAKYIVPSKAASGKNTFSDNLVGNQITDGTSQLTNTNFDLDRVIPEKDSKNFKTSPFSDFLTLDDIKKDNVTESPTTQTKTEIDNTIRFKSAKNDAGRSLYGSLSSRILVSLTRIIKKYPAALYVDSESYVNTTDYTANNIFYDIDTHRTTFIFEVSRIFNPFDILLQKPKSNTLPETDNEIRNFFSSYKKYVLDISGDTYNILEYATPNVQSKITLTVEGKPFGNVTGFTDSMLIRPNNGLTEDFFNGLDEIETQLLNRESKPLYTASFNVPRDSFDKTSTDIIKVSYSWPISKDKWNIKIIGSEYESYLDRLSSLADEIDDYKSNLIVRFLSSPQLFEFDTDDKKGEAVFQLYGQSFDKVKKFIDNIAYMRNVSYDGINNVPDILLKNLAETLGLSTVKLFDEKSLEDILYLRHKSVFDGEPIGKNIIEAEYEFYRRLIVNLAFLFKSKGTRSAIIFFLKFLGAPEPLIRVDEHIYKVTSMPKSKDLETDIYEALRGSKLLPYGYFNPTTYTYTKKIITGSTTFNRAGYPVNELTGEPRRAFDLTTDIFFEKGAGWYDLTVDHRSRDIMDMDVSILTGRTKTLKTKPKPFTYGEEYFDVFRTLPGLDTGYGLENDVDNIKAHPVTETSPYILNRKNIGIYLSASRAIDYDIWRKSRELLITFGTNTLHPQTGVTFVEFVDLMIHSQIRNSHVIRYKKNYITLEDVYMSYMSSSGFTPYNFIDSHEFIKKMSPYWTHVIDQFVPATTQWTGGNLIDNNLFRRSKYQYKLGCQPKEIVEGLYPDFENVIEEDLETILGDEKNFRGLIDITGVTYHPIIEIDGVVYSSPEYVVILSGTTSTDTTARLFDIFPMVGCTSLPDNNEESIPLICDYKDWINPDVTKIKELWVKALSGLIDEVVNKSHVMHGPGYEDYQPYLNATTGTTHPLEYQPLITYEFYIDEDGVEKVKFVSIKYGPNDCSVNNYFLYRFDTEYKPITPTCGDLNVFTFCDVYDNNVESCSLVADVYINLEDVVGVQKDGTGWPVYVYGGCQNDNLNQDLTLSSGRSVEYISQTCDLIIQGVKEHDDIHLNIVDAANCENVITIKGLDLKCLTITGTSTSGYTIEPIVEYTNSYNYGLKWDSDVLIVVGNITIDETTTNSDILNYIQSNDIIIKKPEDVQVDDVLLTGIYKNCSEFSNQQFKEHPLSGFSFTFTYSANTISDVKCLASVKKSIITGLTVNGDITVFEVLPTTQLRVYTNKKILKSTPQTINLTSYYDDLTNVIDAQSSTFNCGINAIVRGNYFFDDRFPEDLQVKGPEIEEPCCDYPKDYMNNHGDYLINVDGYPIEVLAVDLDYCESNLYYNFSFNLPVTGRPDYLVTFDGNVDCQVLLRHKYEQHNSTMDFDLQQYYVDPNCPTPPTVESLIRPIYPNECDVSPVTLCGDITECIIDGFIIETQAPTLGWRPVKECVTEGNFLITHTITGLSSPANVWYDESTGKVWVADVDNKDKGNIYWFYPITATTEADMHYYSGIKANALYYNYIDKEYKRIYMWGTDLVSAGGGTPTGNVTGLVVYDITGNTHYQVSYGSSVAYKRLTHLVTKDYIYGNDYNSNDDFVLINRVNPQLSIITKAISSIPSGSHFLPGELLEVGDSNNSVIWTTNGNNRDVGIYSTNFNTLLKQYTLTGATTASGYYRISHFYDPVYNKVYLDDGGSNQLFIYTLDSTFYNATSITVKNLSAILNGNSMVNVNISIDPVSEKMYAACTLMPTTTWGSQPFTLKTYEIDRSTGEFVRLLNGIGVGEIQKVVDNLSMSLMGLTAGDVFWSNQGTGYKTDGSITFFNNTASSGNTGDVVVKLLEEYTISTSGATGNYKPNVSTDPDYYTPSGYTDFVTCPLTNSLNCITDYTTTISNSSTRLFEFTLEVGVRLNPSITTIKALFYSGSTQFGSVNTYTAPFNGYYAGTTTGLPSSNPSITFHVEYYNDTTLLNPTCTPK